VTMKPWKPEPIPRPSVEPGYVRVKAPFLLQERDHKCTALVGEIIGNWSNCEWLLVEIFAYTSGVRGWVAAELFQEVRKLRPRISLLLKAMKKKIGAAETDRVYQFVLKPLLEMSTERDRIAHANWEMSADYPDCLIAVEGWGKEAQRFLYNVATLEALAAEIRKRWFPLLSLYWACVHASPIVGEGGFIIPTEIDPAKFKLRLEPGDFS
jgi:hypothetical protein